MEKVVLDAKAGMEKRFGSKQTGSHEISNTRSAHDSGALFVNPSESKREIFVCSKENCMESGKMASIWMLMVAILKSA
jgi:hypothetical protein